MAKVPTASLRLFTDWRMGVYLAFSVPAVILEVTFAASILASPNLSLLGPVLRYAAYLPWVLVLLSAVAVLRFRTTILLSLLIMTYFLCAIVVGSADIFGPNVLGAGPTAALVVFSGFLALMSFNYARGAWVLVGKMAKITIERALGFQLLGFAIDFALPVAIALGLVILTENMFHGVEVVVAALPPPLNSVFTSEFVGSITAALLTVLFTTITLWVVRELVEPWVQYFAFTREDAVKQLMYDYDRMISKAERDPMRRPRWVVYTIIVAVALVAFDVLLFGSGTVAGNLGPLFGAGHPTAQHGFYVQSENAFRDIQNGINWLVRLLWG